MKGSLATPRRALRQHRAPLGPRARICACGGRRTAPARLAAASCAHRRPHSVRPQHCAASAVWCRLVCHPQSVNLAGSLSGDDSLRFGAAASRAPKSIACEARSARRYVDASRSQGRLQRCEMRACELSAARRRHRAEARLVDGTCNRTY